MNLVDVAERVAAIERSAVALDVSRCQHSKDRFSTCQACQGVCPVGAIQPGRPPVLNAEACVTCLACLPICPAGAFGADDAVPALLECAARCEATSLELICQQHSRPEHGLAATGTAIRTRGCLAGLGVGALVALAAMGVEAITLRADACEQCAWGAVRGQIEGQVAQAQQLLAPWALAGKLSVRLEAPQPAVARPLLEADNPPLSRRDLFRLAARRGQVMVARAVTDSGGATGPHPARERQRVLKALEALPARPTPVDTALPVGPGFALVQVSSACSACGACARACAPGALEWHHLEPARFQLGFHPERCNGCEACQHVCAPGAIQLQTQPTFAAVFGNPSPQTLIEGDLMRCQRCGAWTAAVAGKRVCPTCDFRRANPFGARPLPGQTKKGPA